MQEAFFQECIPSITLESLTRPPTLNYPKPQQISDKDDARSGGGGGGGQGLECNVINAIS